MMPLSNTYKELVIDELIGLDFNQEAANLLVNEYLPLLEEAEFAGRNAISVAEELAEYKQTDTAVSEMKDNCVKQNAANQQAAADYVPYRILHGHDTPETGYIIEDYPYGYRVRCRQRHWIDVVMKGQYKGKMRHWSQTTTKQWNHLYTNLLHKLGVARKDEHAPPGDSDKDFETKFKKAIHESPELANLLSRSVWNNPKASTSHSFLFLSVDEFGRISSQAIEPYAGPEQWSKFRYAWRVNTPACQFDTQQLKTLAMLEKESRTYNPNTWAEWEAEHGIMELIKTNEP